MPPAKIWLGGIVLSQGGQFQNSAAQGSQFRWAKLPEIWFMRLLWQEAGSEGSKSFLNKCLVQFADLGRFGNERGLSRLGVFRREFNELIRRLHAGEVSKIGLARLKRRLGEIGLGS